MASTPLFQLSLPPADAAALHRNLPACSQGDGDLEVLAQCSRSAEADQVYQAALASCTACTRQLAQDLFRLLSTQLPGASVALCSSMPSGSASSKDWKLRHTYVTVSTGARTLIVEPQFRAHFEVPRASTSYSAFVASLPLLLVVEAQDMQPLVSAISARMAHEIRSMGLPIAPWRSASMLLSRWDSTCMHQEPITRTTPASSSSASGTGASSSSSNSSSSSSSISGTKSSINAASSSGCDSAAAASSHASLPAHSSSASCTNTPKVVVRGFEPASPSPSPSPPPAPAPTPIVPPSPPQPASPAAAAHTAAHTAGSAAPSKASSAQAAQQRPAEVAPTSPHAPASPPKALMPSPASSSSLTVPTPTAQQQPALKHPASTSCLSSATAAPRRVKLAGGMRQALQLSFGAAPAHKPSATWRSSAACLCVECGYTANGEKLRPIFKTRLQGGSAWTARAVNA